MKPQEIGIFSKAASRLASVVRGIIARKTCKSKLKAVPHCIVIRLNQSGGLPVTDVYIIANALKTGQHRQTCYSSSISSTRKSDRGVNWDENLRLSLSGSGVLTLNAFSKNLSGTDTFLGQTLVRLDDLDCLYDGNMCDITLRFCEKTVPVYDTLGSPVVTSNHCGINGDVSISIHIPSIFRNMCGWFW